MMFMHLNFLMVGREVQEEKRHVLENGGMWGPVCLGTRLSGPQPDVKGKVRVRTEY